MMTDYEHIIVSAVRYALGRRSYIVEKNYRLCCKPVAEAV